MVRTFVLTAFAAAILAGCSATTPVPAPSDYPQAVAVIDGVPVTAAEFEDQYARSISSASEQQEDRETFLNRYVNYRLKVLEAQAAGYADGTELKAEMNNYRQQLARPYLLGLEVMDPLIRELYERRTTAVRASHILITVPPDAPAADTLAAWEQIHALRDSALSGIDFGVLASRNSQDPSAARPAGQPGARGDLGFFGGGRMVQPFEDYAFGTTAGDVSPVFRTQFGYHILKVWERQPMPGPRGLAHIMVQPRGQTPADSAEAESRIRSAAARLAEGESFEDVAADISDDRNSARNGGSIGVLSFDQGLPPSMRDVAFSLAEVGDVSDPLQTPFGYHIVKYLSDDALGSLEDEYEALKTQVSQLPRAAAAQAAFAAQVRREVGSRVDTLLIDAWTSSMAGDSLYRTLAQTGFGPAVEARTLATVGDSTYSVADYREYFRARRMPAGATDVRANIMQSLTDFLNERAIDYEVGRLEKRDAEFARTMQEFRDGLILFRLMEDSVWSVASTDTSGLRAYYDARRDDFVFGERTRVISLSSASSDVLSGVRDRLHGGESIAAVQSDTTLAIRVDTTYVDGASGSVYDRVMDLAEGDMTQPVQYNNGFLLLKHAGTDAARPKTFEEARADVVNGYQAELEEALMTRLRAKYSVRTWPERLASPEAGR